MLILLLFQILGVVWVQGGSCAAFHCVSVDQVLIGVLTLDDSLDGTSDRRYLSWP